MSQNSKGVRERVWSARGLTHNLVQHRSVAADGAEARLGPGAGAHAEALIDIGVARLDVATGRLVRADIDHVIEGRDDALPRAERDRLDDVVTRLLQSLRGAVQAGWSEATARRLGLGAIPPTPDQVLQMAFTFLQAWDAETLPPPELGMVIDLSPTVEQLRTETENLSAALDTVAAEVAELQTTLQEKREATAEFDLVLTAVASMGTTFLALGGKDDLARKLKPSSRRSGRTNAVAEGEEPVPEVLDEAGAEDEETPAAPAADAEAV